MLCDQRVQHNGARDGRESDVRVSIVVDQGSWCRESGSGSVMADYVHRGPTDSQNSTCDRIKHADTTARLHASKQ